MTRSNLDRWEDCGEAPQGTSLAQLRSNVLDFRRLKSHANEQDRLECLRQRADGVARDIGELRPIAAEVRRYEGAGRAERGTILDSIAARCAGAARAARAAIEELGDRIWALMRPRKAKTEQRSLDSRKLGPRSARMTTKALKRDLAALERDYGEDDDRSPKARAAEAQRAARARDANRDDRPPQRSWSQSR